MNRNILSGFRVGFANGFILSIILNALFPAIYIWGWIIQWTWTTICAVGFIYCHKKLKR